MLAVFSSIWAFPIGMALTSGNRYRGYPQDMGFSLHSSTIQGNGCSMGCLLTIGIWVLLLGTAAALQFAGQSYKSYFVDSRIENQVAGISLSKADMPMDPEQCAQSLDRLAKASGSTREEVGQAIIAAWKAHAKTYTALYRRERALFFQELEKASAAQPEVPIKELAERLVSRTPASYLAGAQEGKSKPPFATEAKFESLLESISPLANNSAGALEVQFQASRKLESAWRGLLAGGVKLDLLTFVRAVERNMDMLGKNLDSAIKTVSSDIFVHPERFLKPSKKKTPAK